VVCSLWECEEDQDGECTNACRGDVIDVSPTEAGRNGCRDDDAP